MDAIKFSTLDRDCASLGGLFQSIINDLKGSPPIWEDFISKATKLHHQLKATISATSAFLDCFQKVADIATASKGSTRDIGSALTRLCMRHRNLEAKLKQFSSSIMDCLVGPLQEKIPDWRAAALQMDKDHSKDYKRLRADIKRVAGDTSRLEKKFKKSGKGDVSKKLETSRQDVLGKYSILEENEKAAVRQAMVEERSRFCLFVSFLKPVLDEEVSMITEITHLQEIVEFLCKNSTDPFTLPKSSEQVIHDTMGQESTVWAPLHSTPPSSPSSLGSRKSSVCSISSFNSISSGSTTGTGSGMGMMGPPHNGYPTSPKAHPSASVTSAQVGANTSSAPVSRRNNSLPLPPASLRLSSISSQDSGFTSQDTLFLKPQGLASPSNSKQPPVIPANALSTEDATSTKASAPSSPSSPSSSNSSSPPSPQSGGGENGGGGGGKPFVSDAAHVVESAAPVSVSQSCRPFSDDGYNSGSRLSKSRNGGTHGTDAATTTPLPAPQSSTPMGFPRRGSTVSMPGGDFDPGHHYHSGQHKPPIPDKPPMIARKPSLKPTLKNTESFQSPLMASLSTVTSSVPDFNQVAPNQLIPQPVYPSTLDDPPVPNDPYATLKPAIRGSSKRNLRKQLEEDDRGFKPLQQPQSYQQQQQHHDHPSDLLTKCDSQTDLTEALNRSLMMATQAMEELSAMTANELQDDQQQLNQQRVASTSSQSGIYERSVARSGATPSPTPSTSSLRRNSSVSGSRPPPPVRRSSSLSTAAAAADIAVVQQNHSSRSYHQQTKGNAVSRSHSVASSNTSHSAHTVVSTPRSGGDDGGGGGDGSVARGRTALMESLNAKLSGASPQAKLVTNSPQTQIPDQRHSSQGGRLRDAGPAPPSLRNLPQPPLPPQPFALQPHPYANPLQPTNNRPIPPAPSPQAFANPALRTDGGRTGLLGANSLRRSLLSEIKAVGGATSGALRPVRPAGINDRSAPRIN